MGGAHKLDLHSTLSLAGHINQELEQGSVRFQLEQ